MSTPSRKAYPGKVAIYGHYPKYPIGEQLLMTIPADDFARYGSVNLERLSSQGFTVTAVVEA